MHQHKCILQPYYNEDGNRHNSLDCIVDTPLRTNLLNSIPDRAISTPVSYLGNPGFKSPPRKLSDSEK